MNFNHVIIMKCFAYYGGSIPKETKYQRNYISYFIWCDVKIYLHKVMYVTIYKKLLYVLKWLKQILIFIKFVISNTLQFHMIGMSLWTVWIFWWFSYHKWVFFKAMTICMWYIKILTNNHFQMEDDKKHEVEHVFKFQFQMFFGWFIQKKNLWQIKNHK